MPTQKSKLINYQIHGNWVTAVDDDHTIVRFKVLEQLPQELLDETTTTVFFKPRQNQATA